MTSIVLENSGNTVEIKIGNLTVLVKRTDEGASAEIQDENFDEICSTYEDFEENRIAAANLEFEKFDFGKWEIEDQNGWEWETPGNVFARTVYFYHAPNDDFDRDSVKGQFTVTFFPQSAEVQDTTCTVYGNEITTVE